MTIRLVQKPFMKGTHEFEIVDEAVNVKVKSPFKDKELSVVLSVLNPEPVIEGQFVHFHSRVKCDPLISLYRDKPNPEEFNAFVEELKRRVEAYSLFLGPSNATAKAGLANNSYDEPPGDMDPEQERSARTTEHIVPERIEETIGMLTQYLSVDDIGPLIEALQALQAVPQDESRQVALVSAFNKLGPMQGAVLTYAPYIGILLSDDPFSGP